MSAKVYGVFALTHSQCSIVGNHSLRRRGVVSIHSIRCHSQAFLRPIRPNSITQWGQRGRHRHLVGTISFLSDQSPVGTPWPSPPTRIPSCSSPEFRTASTSVVAGLARYAANQFHFSQRITFIPYPDAGRMHLPVEWGQGLSRGRGTPRADD